MQRTWDELAISYIMKYILESLRVHYEMCIWTHTYPVEIMMQGHLGDIWASKCPVEQKIPFGKHLECVSNGYDASACVRRVIALRPEMLQWNHGGDWITDLGVERLFSSWKFAPCRNSICYRVVMPYFLLGGGGNPFIRSKRGIKLILRDGQLVSSVNALSPSSAFWGLELIMAVTLFSWIPPSFASQIHHHIIILGSLESLQGRDRRYPQWSGVMMVQTLISSRL